MIQKKSHMLTRREFVVKSASLAASLPATRLLAALPAARRLQAIGIRFEVPPEAAAETFRALETIGYREMEEPYKDIDEAWPAVQTNSLKKVSVYIDGTLTAPGREDELSRTFEQVKKWGFAYASCSFRAPDQGSGVEKYRVFADRMNKAGEKCRAAGLGPFLYHEQLPDLTPINGTTGYKLLLDEQDQNVCALELDVFWVGLSGQDPAEFLTRLAGRVRIIHMKDKPADLPSTIDHSTASSNMLDVGEGSMDWPGILRAASSAGVEHYIVEPHAASPSDLVVHARKSFEFLSKLEF